MMTEVKGVPSCVVLCYVCLCCQEVCVCVVGKRGGSRYVTKMTRKKIDSLSLEDFCHGRGKGQEVFLESRKKQRERERVSFTDGLLLTSSTSLLGYRN